MTSGVSKVHPSIKEDTGALRLAEVVHPPATRKQIVSLGLHYENLLAAGIKDSDLRDGSLVEGRMYCCGGEIETSSALWFYVPEGLQVEIGDIVEVRMGRQPGKNGPGEVNTAMRVRQKGITNGSCQWVPDKPGLWMRVLYCDWMEQEGWIERKGLYNTWLKPAGSEEIR